MDVLNLDDQVAGPTNGIVPDGTEQVLFRSWNELFGMDREERVAWQLGLARRRFEELAPKVSVLKAQADDVGVSSVNNLSDLVPLLFNHTTYKSYPMSLLEKGRFDLMTKWLSSLTSIDLSSVNTENCTGIDEWLMALEQQTVLYPYHTSGTSGKLTYFPRTTLEAKLFNVATLKIFEGFGDEPGVHLGADGVRLPVIYPSARYGRHTTPRMLEYLIKNVAPTPEQCYTMSNGTLSADLMALSGRIRIAQAKGELDQIKLTEAMRVAFKRYLDETAKRPEEMSQFFARMTNELKGQRVFLVSQTGYLLQAADLGLARGLSKVFAPDSVALIGGGGKGVVLPDGWLERISGFTGISTWKQTYAMTEMMGVMPLCGENHFHIPPYLICFLLDPATGAALPEEATQTGQFAAMDLIAQTYWAGIVTGDKVTVTWDQHCPCGRKGPFVHNNISRYDEAVTGDDKVTCSATIDNTDAALQQILSL